MSEYGRSRKLKKSNNIVVFIILIVLIGCIAYFAKQKFFSNERNDVAESSVDSYGESSVSETTDISTEKNESTSMNVGDTVTFGSYPQSDASGNNKEPIEWVVLDKQDGAVLLFSKYILDCKPYNTEYTDITWVDCSLRAWLNAEFLNTAFDMYEYGKIQKTALINDNNSDYNTDGGSDTDDRVFCLSIEEAMKYFGPGKKDDSGYDIGKSIATTATNYAKAVENGSAKLLSNSNSNAWYYGYSAYWLRSPGAENIAAANVGSDGYLTTAGANVSFGDIGVRPAIWLYENWIAPNDSILFN